MGKSCVLPFFFNVQPTLIYSTAENQNHWNLEEQLQDCKACKKEKIAGFYLFMYQGKVNSLLIKDVLSQAPFRMSAKC